MLLKDFLLNHTQANELCAVTVGGWVQTVVYVDHEDIFLYSLSDKLAKRPVKSHHWDIFPIVNSSGEAVPTPVHYIEVGD